VNPEDAGTPFAEMNDGQIAAKFGSRRHGCGREATSESRSRQFSAAEKIIEQHPDPPGGGIQKGTMLKSISVKVHTSADATRAVADPGEHGDPRR